MLQGKEMLGIVLDYGKDFIVIKQFLKSLTTDGNFYGERITLIPLSQIKWIDLESEVYDNENTGRQISDSSGVRQIKQYKHSDHLQGDQDEPD